MNAPLKPGRWSNATLATIRMHAEERSTRTAAMVLAALSREPIPASTRALYDCAQRSAFFLADLAVTLVESRDASVVADVCESSEGRAENDAETPQQVCDRLGIDVEVRATWAREVRAKVAKAISDARCPTEDDEGRCIFARGHAGGCDTENK